MLLLGLLVNNAVAATGVDTSNWLCSFCSYPRAWLGSFEVGPGYANEPSLKFGDHRGIEDKGTFLSIYGDLHYRNDSGGYFDLYTRDVGTSARQLEMRGGRRGRFEFRLVYRETPKYRGFGTQTPFQGTGSSQLVLPPSWVSAFTTDGLSGLGSQLNPLTLDTSRKAFGAGLSLRISSKWHYQLDIHHTEKTGTRPFGGGVLTIHSAQLPAPVDFTTNRIEMGLEYAGEQSRVRFGFSSTYFNNDNASLTWENPFSPIGATQLLRAALEPDNDFYQFSLTGTFKATPRLQFSGRAAVGRTRQDEPFLAYSSNPDFSTLQLPRASLGGKLDTSSLNLAARGSARLTRKLRLNVRLKIDEKDNRTPVEFYTPVITDLAPRPETPNRPYSFKRSQYSAELSYRATPWLNFNAGTKLKNHDRTLQAVRETEDLSWWGDVNFTHWAAAQLRLKIETSDRSNSPYVLVSDPGLQENILMRKFNLADRQRDRVVLELNLAPTEQLSAGLSYFVAKDRYERSLLGLLGSDEDSFNLDLGFAFSPNINLHGFVTRDEYDSEISGATDPDAKPWRARTEDRFTTFGVGLSGKLGTRIDLGLDFISSISKGRITTDKGAGEAPFPQLKTDLQNTRIHLSYRVSPRWGWKLYAEHEKYTSTDWQIDGLGNDGLSAILTLGEVSPDYKVTLLRLLANYTF